MASTSTPVTRHPRALRRRPLLSSSTPTSTPVSDDDTPHRDRLHRFRPAFEDEDFPLSQFQIPKDGEVYWNYEASPSVQSELQRKVKETEARSPAPIVKLKVEKKPVFKLKGMRLDDPEESAEAMKDLCQIFMQNSKEESPKCDKTGSETDPFGDSEDDSFLLKCTQVVEQREQQRKVETEIEAVDDPFDGNDSFDMLLSQVDERILTKSKAPLPLVNQPQAISRTDHSGMKRFLSAGDTNTMTTGKSEVKLTKSSSSSIFNRTHSSPETYPTQMKTIRKSGSVRTNKLRCTQDEIEKKRMEALKKRKIKQSQIR